MRAISPKYQLKVSLEGVMTVTRYFMISAEKKETCRKLLHKLRERRHWHAHLRIDGRGYLERRVGSKEHRVGQRASADVYSLLYRPGWQSQQPLVHQKDDLAFRRPLQYPKRTQAVVHRVRIGIHCAAHELGAYEIVSL